MIYGLYYWKRTMIWMGRKMACTGKEMRLILFLAIRKGERFKVVVI